MDPVAENLRQDRSDEGAQAQFVPIARQRVCRASKVRGAPSGRAAKRVRGDKRWIQAHSGGRNTS